jgi:hypothetical protein
VPQLVVVKSSEVATAGLAGRLGTAGVTVIRAAMRRVRLTAPCLLAVALVAPPVADAQQPTEKVPRIGWLSPGPGTIRESSRKALQELGYIEGRTISLEVRGAGDNLSRLPTLAAELVEAKVDVIVAVSLPVPYGRPTRRLGRFQSSWRLGALAYSNRELWPASPGRGAT